jgi:hypothetical protein
MKSPCVMVNILGTPCFNANLVYNCLDKTVRIQNNIKKSYTNTLTEMFCVAYYNFKDVYGIYQIYHNGFSIH